MPTHCGNVGCLQEKGGKSARCKHNTNRNAICYTAIMDKIPKLGNLITDKQHRDAVHIAVAPVTAGMALWPGQRVGFVGNAHTVGITSNTIGIVDPFLTNQVQEGEMFYMFLLPNTITSLRHEWTHPVFEEEDQLAAVEPTLIKLKGSPAEEKWISDFAAGIGSTYGEIMEGAKEYLVHGSYLVRGGTFEGYSIPDEFWDKYETIKRTKVAFDARGTFIGCSC